MGMGIFRRTLFAVIEAACLAAIPFSGSGAEPNSSVPAQPGLTSSVPARPGNSLSPSKQPTLAEVPQLIAELDSAFYDTRQQAARRMEQLVASPEFRTLLAEKLHQLAVRPDTSYEVRWRLDEWRAKLPAVISTRPANVSVGEIEQLVRQLDDDMFSVRVGAGERLQWLAGDERLAGTIMALLKNRLMASDLSDEALRRLEPAWEVAWGTWLNSDAAAGQVASATDEQISRWLEELLQPNLPSDRSAARRHQLARHELLSALVHDSQVPRIQAAIEKAIQARANLSVQRKAAADLKELTDLLRPSMVAEIWRGHQQVTEQHLVIGVPQMGPYSLRPSHFDAIDENTAHCASGNTLSPGDYPVGVAFPMPRSSGTGFFYLVNLPTPRRQIAYFYHAKTDSRARLAALSRRTLDRFLATKRVLKDAEVAMLAQLDLDEVSRFAGRYFMTIEDTAADDELDLEVETPTGHITGKPSLFGAVCEQLALNGTQEAAPGLLEAMRKKRFLPPNSAGPYQLPQIAALAIARRDPWPNAHAWLAEIAPSREVLIKDQPKSAEFGATAAALLLTSQGESLRGFALQPVFDAKIRDLGVDGYRYSAPDGVRQVQEWWKRKHEDRKGGEPSK
jgi:hypothetical protein